MTKRPIIGIVLDEALDPAQDGSAFARRPYYALRMAYFDAIARAGGVPVAIPYAHDALEDYVRLCDGWLIPGGDYRFDPAWYAAPPPSALAAAPTLRRDFEAALIPQLLARDTPVLGICNGMQVMAGASGGKISYVGHVPRKEGSTVRHGDPATGVARHDVTIAPDTRLSTILPSTLEVSSAHKEDVVSLAAGAVVTARAPDGVIEALEFPGLRFALGVQWHPELDAKAQSPLFAALIEAARAP